jgi:hypothetical protein
MTIKYKFNKSSEARDCVVESVELVEIQKKKRIKIDYGQKWSPRDPYAAFILEQERVNYKEPEKVEIKYDKQFTSQQELKDYINSIQEPIEFISESSIDDVLMKEWIGEWDYTESTVDSETGIEWLTENSKKTGSPKLNSNWTFKIV